jgi:hypothetical protein
MRWIHFAVGQYQAGIRGAEIDGCSEMPEEGPPTGRRETSGKRPLSCFSRTANQVPAFP